MDYLIKTYQHWAGHGMLGFDASWYVYSYHHIDELGFMVYATDVLLPTQENIVLMAQVLSKFKQAGWEGDGKLQVGWIPPFAEYYGDTFGSLFWHVKQVNNGTSYIATNADLSWNPDISKVDLPTN